MTENLTETEILLRIAEKGIEMRKEQISFNKFKLLTYFNRMIKLEAEFDILTQKLKSLRENVLIGEQQSLF